MSAWSIRFYGVRGSFPIVSPGCMVYGGNTVSTALYCGCHLILDAGSGLRKLGQELAKAGMEPIYLLLSHFHLDHVIGLLDFAPFFQPGREIHIYAEPEDSTTLKAQIWAFTGKPYWPVSARDVSAEVHFHEIGPNCSFCVGGGIEVQTLRSCHPGKTLAFRMDGFGHSMGYGLDYELAMDKENRLAEFFRNCDAAILDGTYQPGREIPGWGHSSWKQALELCQNANISMPIISHFSTELEDSALAAEEALAVKELPKSIFAREGMKRVIK